MLVASTNLKNPSNPTMVRSLPRLHRFVRVLLALDSRAVGDEDEVLAVVFYPVHCRGCRVSPERPKCGVATAIRTNEAVISCHVDPLLFWSDEEVAVHCIVGIVELARRRKGRNLQKHPRRLLRGMIFRMLGPPLLLIRLFVAWIRVLDLEGAFCTGLVRLGPWSLARGRHG